MNDFKKFLIEKNACEPAIKWLGERDIEQTYNDCERGDWLLWLAHKLGLSANKRRWVGVAGRCAATVKYRMKDERSIAALRACEQYEQGIISDKELYAANADAADAAYAAYAANAAYAAADAAYAATAAAANAVYAAAAADNAAYAAPDADANRKQTADMVRQAIPLSEFVKAFDSRNV